MTGDWTEERQLRIDAIRGSAMLRDAILAHLRPALPVVWFEPEGVKPRIKAKKPEKRVKVLAPPVFRLVRKRGPKPIPFSINPEIERIKDAVADHYGIERSWMERHSNSWSVARPRMVAMYLARVCTKASYPNIGRHFDRDHTTVLHAFAKVQISPDLLTDSTAIRMKIGDNALRISQECDKEQSVKTQEERLAA